MPICTRGRTSAGLRSKVLVRSGHMRRRMWTSFFFGFTGSISKQLRSRTPMSMSSQRQCGQTCSSGARSSTTSASSSEKEVRPAPLCPAGRPPRRRLASSSAFGFVGIFEDGVELPNGFLGGAPSFPTSASGSPPLSIVSSSAMRLACAAMTALFLRPRSSYASSFSANARYLLHRL